MRDAKLKEKEAMRVEVRENIELLAPAAASREKALVNAIASRAKEKVAVRAAGGAAGSSSMDTSEV
jgi:hypothetical protein